ncbi:MAG TPA: hypothetical protein VFZ75_12685 [Actinomycetota bacterium]|nr:hypothetical protein [Actinomycetota bacterium]
MTERLHAMDDGELSRALAGLEVAWPDAPDLTAGVMARARARGPGVVRLPLSRTRRTLLIAAAIVLLLAGAAVAARIAIDLGAVVVEVEPRPSALPSTTTAPDGTPLSVAEAERLLGEELPLPAELGAPDRVWADEVFTDAGRVVRVTTAWEPGPELPAIEGSRFGAVLMRFEGDTDQAFKDVYEDTGAVEPAFVDGREAVWTAGPHVLRLLTSEGLVDVRVNGNVLLWTDGQHTMRLETAVSKSDAVRIATSVGTD